MSNCPTSSFSILQESLLANVHRKLNWGSVSGGTGKIMMVCAPTLGHSSCLWLQRNAIICGLMRGCPSAQSPALPQRCSCPSLWNCQSSPPRPAMSTGEQGRRGTGWKCLWCGHEALSVPWEPLGTEGSAEEKASRSHSKIVLWSRSWTAACINSCLFDEMGLTKLNTVWEGFLSTASHGIS